MWQIRELAPNEIERVGAVLGLARLGQGDGYYLVAWEDDEPLGHGHLALTDPPELQDVSVRPEHRRRGVATALAAAAEHAVVARGFARLRLSVSVDNEAAMALYRGLGYGDVGIPSRRVHGTIKIRTGTREVDDTLLTWEKSLAGMPSTLAEVEPGRRSAVDHDDSMRMLKAIAKAFDEHDLDGIMAHFADDAVFEGPRGTEPWGTRFVGAAQIREGFAARFSGIPDIRYQQDEHFVDGDRGASEWTLSGTTTEGQRIEVRGCDLWTFRDGKVVKKDSYWKIRTTG